MPKEAYQVPAPVLKGRGMDDTIPISPLPTWFNTNGIIEDAAVIKRLEGKVMLQRCNSPVIGLHAGLKNLVWVQTATQLLLFQGHIEPVPPPPLPSSISGTGTILSLSGDDNDTTLALGFNFPFYGVNYNTVTVTTNGVIGLSTIVPGWPWKFCYQMPSNYPFGATFFKAHLGIFPTDLEVSGAGKIYYLGTANSMIIEWNHILSFNGTADDFTFQVVLRDDGTFSFNYLNMDYDDGIFNGVIGYQNALGTVGHNYANDTNFATTGLFLNAGPT